MTHRLSILGFALILGLSLAASAGAVPVAELGQNWGLGMLQTSAATICSAETVQASVATDHSAPLFLMASEEVQSCWCCAKTGHPDCCNPCFDPDAE